MSSERDVVLSKWMECFKALLNRDSSKSNVHPSPKTRIDVIPDSDQDWCDTDEANPRSYAGYY